MGPSFKSADKRRLPEVTANLLEKAGLNVVYPTGLRGLCCGQPFLSKGMMSDAEKKLREVCVGVCVSLCVCVCVSLSLLESMDKISKT
jgi:D-lactate dehydrogenase